MRVQNLILKFTLLGSILALGQDAVRPVPTPPFTLTRWAREPLVMDPVALAFDDLENLYVAETARRSTVDIDIRSHREWLLDDLAHQSVDDLRRSFHRWMAPERSLDNAGWLRDLNGDGLHDWQDLEMVKERVRRLEGPVDNRNAARSQVFAEGFNEEISGVIAGVLPWENDVWVTAYPQLTRFQDTDGDGRADRSEVVYRGFGVHAAFDGHDLHGLMIGPDGKIYFTCGDNGFSVTNREGKRLHFPNTGGVLRMHPDGSNLEVFASGLRNPQEVAFDENGNLFAVDNDGDLKDERERFVYITEGSDSGWRLNWQFREPGWADVTGQPNYNPWIDERMWTPHHRGQPAHITPPLTNYSVGPGSFRFNPGTAINEKYRGHFFLIQFPVAKVTAFRVRPQGASFEMEGEHTVLSGMMASALCFSPGGALAVGDWDGLWSPNETGSVWLLDDPSVANSRMRQEVRELLRNGLSHHSTAALTDLLSHEDQRIRMRSQFQLVRRGTSALFQSLATNAIASHWARIHAMWGLTQLGSKGSLVHLPLGDNDSNVRAQAAKAAGELRLTSTTERLVELLKDPSMQVRFQAALALGKIGVSRAVPALVEFLGTNDNEDAFLRHGAVMGLTGIGDKAAMLALTNHASAAVRMGAVLVLRRLHSPYVSRYLNDSDRDVRREAVRAIYDDDSIPEAMESLARLFDGGNVQNDEAVARRVVGCNLRLADTAHARRLVNFAADLRWPESFRIDALEALGDWDRSPPIDRVEGQIRSTERRPPGLGRKVIEEKLDSLLSLSGEKWASSLTRLIIAQRIPAPPDVFVRWVNETNQPVGVRVQALELLAQKFTPIFSNALRSAQYDSAPEMRTAALSHASRHNVDLFIEALRDSKIERTLPEQQVMIRLAGPLSQLGVRPFMLEKMDRLNRGDLPSELLLDTVEAAKFSTDPEVQSELRKYEQQLSANGKDAHHKLLLKGGDAVLGQQIFRTSVIGQCVRCHDAGGEGFQAGPVLKGIGTRATRDYLLESLLNPNAQIAPGFATIFLTLKGGETIDGLLLQEIPGQLKLRLSNGETRTVSTSEISERAISAQSSMPSMAGVLNPRELRDLVEFLSQWK